MKNFIIHLRVSAPSEKDIQELDFSPIFGRGRVRFCAEDVEETPQHGVVVTTPMAGGVVVIGPVAGFDVADALTDEIFDAADPQSTETTSMRLMDPEHALAMTGEWHPDPVVDRTRYATETYSMEWVAQLPWEGHLQMFGPFANRDAANAFARRYLNRSDVELNVAPLTNPTSFFDALADEVLRFPDAKAR